MTLNSKVLSLVLLTGLTMGGTFAKKQKAWSSDWSNDSKSVEWSKDECDGGKVDPGLCNKCEKPCAVLAADLPAKCIKKVCCSALCSQDCSELLECCLKCEQQLCFKAGLSTLTRIDDYGAIISPCDNPAGINCGSFELCFNKQLNQFAYRLTVCVTEELLDDELTRPDLAVLAVANIGEAGFPNDSLRSFFTPFKIIPIRHFDAEKQVFVVTGCFNQNTAFSRADAAVPSLLNYIPLIWKAFLDLRAQVVVFGPADPVSGARLRLLQGTLVPCCC